MSEQSSNAKAATFVTVLGWILVVFTAFGAVTSLMQNVMVNFMFPSLTEQGPEVQTMPRGVLLVFRVLAAFMLCLTVFLVFSAWSFLKRRNWARKLFVVLFALGAAWGCFVFLAFGLGMGVFNLLPPTAPPEANMPSSVGSMFRVMGIMFGLLAVAISALFVWLIKRLRSPEIRSEFESVPAR